MAEITAAAALGIGKITPRVYIPRVHHRLWKEQMHVLIGVASHIAYDMLSLKYKAIRLKGYDKFKEHKATIASLIKTWLWELHEPEVKAHLGL